MTKTKPLLFGIIFAIVSIAILPLFPISMLLGLASIACFIAHVSAQAGSQEVDWASREREDQQHIRNLKGML